MMNSKQINRTSQTEANLGAKPSRSSSLRQSKPHLLSTCSLATALVFLQFPQSAFAQIVSTPGVSVSATASYNAAEVSYIPDPVEDQVDVLTAETIINWTTNTAGAAGTEVTFLAPGRNLRFVGLTDFTVLNRVFTPGFDSAIRIDGNVASDVAGATGGNIWFFSLGGIVAGATSAFDVGSLVLTANNIDTTGGLFGAGNTIRFRGAAGSTAGVAIENGARINANNNGSYVALVAPRVVQGGTVSVNGSAAYVGAEQADLTINQGLFDISVSVGTTDAHGVIHEASGTTTGASSAPTPAGVGGIPPANPDAQAIYLVAVPKNDAITMLVAGSLGYQPAAGAGVVNGNVVLSAGHNVTTQSNAPSISNTAVNANVSTIEFGTTTLNATTTAQATNVDMMLTGAEVLTVSGTTYDLNVSATNQIDFGGSLGGEISAGRGVSLKAGSGAQGGTVNIAIDRNTAVGGNAGTVDIAGDFNADANALGSLNLAAGSVGENATAGTVALNISQGGSFNVAGLARLSALAQAGSGRVSSGTAQSGNVTVNLSDVGSILNIADLTLDVQSVDATQGLFATQASPVAGLSRAGNATININGGSFIAPFVTIDATGNGSFSALSGGAAQGGSALFNLNGGTATINLLNLVADANGGIVGAGNSTIGLAGGQGGSATGGSAALNATAGTLTAANINIQANTNTLDGSGRGGNGDGVAGGNGGDSTGGAAVMNLNGSATVNAGTVVVRANSLAGNGGISGIDFAVPAMPAGGVGGNGGNASGGSAAFNHVSGTFNRTSLDVQATSQGGNGGDNVGITIGDSSANGGSGGDATGGTAVINLQQDDLTNPTYSTTASATGGAGGSGLNGGVGGAANGGTAAINIINANIRLRTPMITAIATGGAGGFSDGDGGNGGDGGDATGGTARIEVTGANGNFPTTDLVLTSSATGGTGQVGNSTFSTTSPSGTGGTGGSATGGSSEIIARTGGAITVTTATPYNLISAGTGGNGGNAGNLAIGSALTASNGGNGGSGTGGNIRLLAQGGTITTGAISFTASGTGGNGGNGGQDGAGAITGAAGAGANGTGGSTTIEVQEGSPGVITLGATSLTSKALGGSGSTTGTAIAGHHNIIDSSTDVAGLITLASLNAQALGATAAQPNGFSVSGNSGNITVTGDAVVATTGNAAFNMAGNGQFSVNGNATITSGASILVTHSGRAANLSSIAVARDFTASAQTDFNSMPGSRISTGGAINIRAEQNVNAANLAAALGRVDVSAGRNVMLGDASLGGAPMTVGAVTFYPDILIQAGRVDPNTVFYDPQYNATLAGTVTSTGNITVLAGGNIITQAGANISADNFIGFASGDDIIVQLGSTISAAQNPFIALNTATPFANQAILSLNAGGLSGSLNSTALTPISSLLAQGNLNTGNSAAILFGDAISGLGGSIAAASIRADARNAPTNAAIAAVGQSNDNGLLAAPCLQGNICLGVINATGRLEIGQSGIPIELTTSGGTVNATDILVTTRRDLIVGTVGTASTFSATNSTVLESVEGNVDIRDVTINSAIVGVTASNGSLLGTGTLVSANDVGITVAGDINARAINAGRQLTTVANLGGGLEPVFAAPGNVTIGTLTQGDTNPLQITTPGSIDIGSLVLPAQNVSLIAGGNATLGSTTGTRAIIVTADNIGFSNLVATDDISLTASNGNITGGAANATGSILLTASNDITTGNLVAGRAVSVTATAGNATSSGLSGVDAINVTAGTTASIANANGGPLNMMAANITLGSASVDTAVLNATTNIDVTALSASAVNATAGLNANLGTTTSGSSILVTAVNATATSLDAATTMDITATGTTTLGTARTRGGNLNIASTNGIAVQNVAVAGDTSLTATNGTVTVASDIATSGTTSLVAQSIDITTLGALSLTNAQATDGNVNIVAQGDLTVTQSSASADVTLTSVNGTVAGTNSTAGRSLAISGRNGVAFASLSSSADTAVTSNGIANIGTASANTGPMTINAAGGVEANTITTGGDLTLSASSGNVAIRTDVKSGGIFNTNGQIISLTATGNLDVNKASASAGNVDITSNGSLSVGSADATADVNLTSTGSFVDIVSATAGNGASVSGSSISASSVTGQSVSATGGNITISAQTNANLNADVVAQNNLSITAGNTIGISALASAQNIQITTGDLNISNTGQLGRSDATNMISITSNGTQRLVLGGSGTTGTFSIDQDEFSRIFSNGSIEITANQIGTDPARAADITIENLAVKVGSGTTSPTDGQIGSGGSFTITTDGKTDVTGPLSLGGTGADNQLNIQSDEAIFIDASTGSISVRDIANSLSGQLSLAAPTIIAATVAARGEIDGLDADAIETRLSNNDGLMLPGAILQAGTMNITFDNGLFIQNTASGTNFDNRRGFHIGDGGLTLNTSGDSSKIVINGIQTQSPTTGTAPTIVTGVTLIPNVSVVAPTGATTGFDPLSTINGCTNGDTSGCITVTMLPTDSQLPPDGNIFGTVIKKKTPSEEEDEEIKEEIGKKKGSDIFNPDIIILKNFDKPGFAPLIDEPVTGVGNDDLWTSKPTK